MNLKHLIAYDFYDYVTANYPEIIQKMDDDHRDYILSTFDEEASNKFDRFIERMKEEEKISINQILGGKQNEG